MQDSAAKRLSVAGIDTARLDARVLVGHALGQDAGWLIGHADEVLTDDAAAAVEAAVARRERREPLAYILGYKEFWSLEFKVTPATLIPRPETETIVEAVLARLPDRSARLRVLDLGTGSGCLLLSLLSECPYAEGIGIDQSEAALTVARANGDSLALSDRVSWCLGDWWSAPVDGDFDIVVTNPPYITDAEMTGLAPEIALHEPDSALRAGNDGLDDYRKIFAGLPPRLRSGGVFAGEIGWRQAQAAARLAEAAGLRNVDVLNDAAGLPRCVVGYAAD